ncbi:MAG: hypothetical protein ABIO44_13145 [Saprospiraceae bacterium]
MFRHISPYYLLFICLLLTVACSDKLYSTLDQSTKDQVFQIKQSIQEINQNKYSNITLYNKPTESIIYQKNANNEIVKLTRKINSTGFHKTTEYYFKNAVLLSSLQMETNSAKVKNKLLVVHKQHYFSSEKTIFAEKKEVISKKSEEKILKEISRKKPIKFEASPYLLRDELSYIEKIKTLINK